jgi:formylglycine-generating enzyme required for sulfatase activity
MDPMRFATDKSPRSHGASASSAAGTAETVAVADPEGPRSAEGLAARRTSTTARRPGSSKMGLFVALGVGSVAAVAAAASVLGARKTSATVPATASATASAAASASPSVPTAAKPQSCPNGMVAIPGGSFFMGSDDGLPFEKPAHQVVLGPYCIDKHEVTVREYRACSDSGRCKRAGTANEWPDITAKERKVFDPLCNIREPEARATHPINCVDWEMADKFCREQGKRLPTEAEWEFAARGPDGRKYPWGDEDPTADRLNACGKECVEWGLKNGVEQKAMYDADDGFPNTAPVGSFPKGASRYGVEDVVGNVWEWVADWYGPYGKDERNAPTGPTEGEERVIRGGAWNGSYASWVRPTFRYKSPFSKRSYGVGLRCAASR